MHTLDLRTLADEWNEKLVELAEDGRNPSYGEMIEECGPYESLCDELGIESNPDSLLAYANDIDPTLISDDDFEEYARDLAESIGAIDPNANWPLSCIDWEKAADELRADYSSVEYDGTTYLHRS